MPLAFEEAALANLLASSTPYPLFGQSRLHELYARSPRAPALPLLLNVSQKSDKSGPSLVHPTSQAAGRFIAADLDAGFFINADSEAPCIVATAADSAFALPANHEMTPASPTGAGVDSL